MSAQYRHEQRQQWREQLSSLLVSVLNIKRSHPLHRRLLDRCLHQLDPVVHRFQDTRSRDVRDDVRRWTERLGIHGDELAAYELETAFAAFERRIQQQWQAQHEQEAQYRIVALLLRLARLPSTGQLQRQRMAGEVRLRHEERAAEQAVMAGREQLISVSDDDDDGWEAEFNRFSDSEVDDAEERREAGEAAHLGSTIGRQADGRETERSRPASSHRPSYLTALEEVWPYIDNDAELERQQQPRRLRRASGGEGGGGKELLPLLQPEVVTLQLLLDPERDSSTPLVSEQLVLCHLLLLCLQLPNALFVWDEQAAEYVALQPLAVSHLSAASLASIIGPFARHATNTRRLRIFVQTCCSASLRHSSCAHRLGCCLAAYLDSHERWLSQALAAVETTAPTLLSLSEQLAASMKQVDALQSLTARLSPPALPPSAAGAASAPPSALDTARLLSELHSQYALASLRDDRQLAALLLSLFLETLSPYLEALHTVSTAERCTAMNVVHCLLLCLTHVSLLLPAAV